MGWLPQVFIDNGIGKTQAGLLVGLVSLIGVPVALLHLAAGGARSASQSGWIVALGVLGLRRGGRPAGGPRRAAACCGAC